MKTKRIRKSIFIISIICALSISCSNEIDVKEPDMEVRVLSNTVKAGEPVQFMINGNPDFIMFYSGENGNDYAYHNKDRITPVKMIFSFLTTSVLNGSAGILNPKYTPVHYSIDYNGQADSTSIANATWIDISERFQFPTETTLTQTSGDVDITDLFPDPETPIFLRFYYKVHKYNSLDRIGRTRVTISNMYIKGDAGYSQIDIYDAYNMEWKLVLGHSYAGQTTLPEVPALPSKERLYFTTQAWNPSQDHECWMVSDAIHLMKEINAGQEYAIPIKTMTDPALSSYTHSFKTPGTYMVTFVAMNASVYGKKESIVQVELVVTD